MHKLNAIANKIRATRIFRNYTQYYLAAKLKISQNAYSKIELGRTKVTVEKLLTIADVLEIDACELINPESGK
jgi:transcriptional regulator with XRE-family HTH domain